MSRERCHCDRGKFTKKRLYKSKARSSAERRSVREGQVTTGVIYDFGMNNGDDVEYYLLKGARVVGAEANRSLCEGVRARFADAVARGDLVVLNVALAEEDSSEPITFWLHKTNHRLSQLPEPDKSIIGNFEPVQVPCRTPASIIQEFGEPLYVKIDVEHFDVKVLENIFAAGVFPPEISAESHSIGVFCCLVTNGYNCFSLVEGWNVPKTYGNATVQTPSGPRQFNFRPHSAGPFGEDIRSRWEDADAFFTTLAQSGLGWKDIHASTVVPPAQRP